MLHATALMQRSFLPGMQLMTEGQVHSGSWHSASGQPPGLKRKPKRAQESSATGGKLESSVLAGSSALLVQATSNVAPAASSASTGSAPSRRAGPGAENGAIRAA